MFACCRWYGAVFVPYPDSKIPEVPNGQATSSANNSQRSIYFYVSKYIPGSVQISKHRSTYHKTAASDGTSICLSIKLFRLFQWHINVWSSWYVVKGEWHTSVASILFWLRDLTEAVQACIPQFERFCQRRYMCPTALRFCPAVQACTLSSSYIPSAGQTQDPKWGFSCKIQRRPTADFFLNESLPPKTLLWTPCSWPPWPWFSREKSLKIFKVL